MILALFKFLLSIIIYLFGSFVDLILSFLPLSIVPNLAQATSFLNTLYTYVFNYIDWFRNALFIDNLTLSLIIDIFIIKYTVKPTIAVVKIIINWITDLK